MQGTLVPEEEKQIIQRCKEGDQQAFGALYEAYQAKAYGAAFLLCSDHAVAADAIQEAFIKAFLALPRFRQGEPFRPWFFRILM